MRHSRLVIVMLLVASWAHVAVAQPEVEKLVAESNPAIQAQIRTTVIAFGSAKQSDIKTNWRSFREMTTLKELTDDEEQLVKQLAIYAVVEQRPEETQVLEAQLVLHFLDVKPRILIRALAPYLDSDNKQLREFAREWFEGHDSTGPAEWPLNAAYYQEYVNYVRDKFIRNEEVPVAFVEYLYQRSPGWALLVFSRAFGQRHVVARLQEEARKMEAARQGLPIPRQPAGQQQQDREQRRELLLAEHIVSNAIWLKTNQFDERFQQALPEVKELLAKLSQHDQWWVRLYVAEIMRRHREFRLADVLDKLSRDDNESVRKAAKSVEE